jgi:hypothetical protein
MIGEARGLEGWVHALKMNFSVGVIMYKAKVT